MTLARQSCDGVIRISNEANSADGRCWQYARAVSLIVKRHIAGDDRHVEGSHGSAYAFDSAYKLPHNFWFLRIAKIQIICGGKG